MTLFPADDSDPGIRRVSLVRLSALVAQAAASIGKISVEGEVHRVQQGRSGRLWFTLRDRAAQISVSVPAARRSRSRAVAGERVSVVGRLEWVNEWGQLQLVADEITPVGEGAIAAAISEARRRLDADGLLTRPRRPIPVLPAAIAVVCGHEAAVRADIESVVAARFPGYPMVFRETTVSGPGAVDNIVTALQELGQHPGVEVIILARGGGDATQLVPFSDEAVCRAVCRSTVPVVAAIGHDGDRPLVDEVADLRCGTPSLAAGAVVPDRAWLTGQVDGLLMATRVAARTRLETAGRRLGAVDRDRAVRRGLEVAAATLERAGSRVALLHPVREFARAESRLARLQWREPAMRAVGVAEAQLGAVRLRADALSPSGVLGRGYAVVRRSDGTVVRHPASVAAGEMVDVEVAAGSLSATVVSARTRP